MNYRYLLKHRPPHEGTYPPEGVTRVDPEYFKNPFGEPYYGVAEYDRPLPADEIGRYELEYWPTLSITVNVVKPLQDRQWDEQPIPADLWKSTWNDLLKILGDADRYFKTETMDEYKETGAIRLIRFVDASKKEGRVAFTSHVVRFAFGELYEWMAAAFMLFGQGCPIGEFDGLTAEESMDKAVTLTDSGRYAVIDDCLPWESE